MWLAGGNLHLSVYSSFARSVGWEEDVHATPAAATPLYAGEPESRMTMARDKAGPRYKRFQKREGANLPTVLRTSTRTVHPCRQKGAP